MSNTDNVILFPLNKRPDNPTYSALCLVVDRMIDQGIYPDGNRQEIIERVYRRLNRDPT